jgi:antitoxin component of RelBE/YafQ-DinJ toxin-antitoxin module
MTTEVSMMAKGATLYLRGMPESLVREAKAVAARRGITLTELVREALRGVVGEAADPGDERALEESVRWYRANRGRLLRHYRDQYVAIEGKKVIDHDRDFDALARRVFARLGNRPVFMPKVTGTERVARLPSPAIVRG